MAAVLVSYDLNAPGQSYDKLIAQIKTYPGWCPMMKSAWMVYGPNATAQSVSDDLRSVMDGGDNLLCIEVSGKSRQGWLSKDKWEWMNTHL
ncbi:hypothetical protein [Frigoribacterium sp. PhB118]|uniref:hypothetical protein n=1 Tax=Frigoribacterium sp. PhB118 TaxID=2485175 RepID=UPI000F4AB0DE|nr:hypothetical protein [Frigoribacterium sp. PhB118]ROS57022.1 hypothetical protein EDF21_0675 [Frigoribacterium sp. PhB118]